MRGEHLLARITRVSQKLASEIHLRSLRDSFIITVPFLVLAGLFIMVNYVFLDPKGMLASWLSGDTLISIRHIGDRILNGTMNILSLMLVVLISWNIATKRKFMTPIIPAMVSLAAFLVLMPLQLSLLPVNGETPVAINGVISFAATNAGGVFVAILTAVLSTNLFLWISHNKRLQIRLGDDVPPMVAQSFQSMFSIILTVLAFAVLAVAVQGIFHKEINEIIQDAIQAPLVHLTTNLPGFLVLTTLTNLLFSLGIHPSGIINPILEPPLLVAMQENMAAFAKGDIPPHIIVLPFRDLYGHMGGTGTTLALLIALLLRSKMSSHKKFARTVLAPGIFNINEPVIFGFPVLYNPLMMIPFVIYPQISFVIAYFATQWGMVSKIVAFVPWSVPPLISGWLGSGGDLRNVILQIGLLVLGVMIYLPFLVAYEKTLMAAQTKKQVDEMINPVVEADLSAPVFSQPKTIILMCNEGMSTSIMAKKMSQYAQAENYPFTIFAINMGRLQDEYQKADLILLGPQLAYMQESICQQINQHCAVGLLDKGYFSKLDGKSAVLDTLQYFKM
ncbi:PTS transporter subunit EIIC [Enterobacter sp. ENT03]|uniref:PTS transporter subunit EIIC n=1 Tax=Enterobacter sp. ENT03 TaxID=2854780 RepID=UPI001C45653D|nr:PTS transporter subunit EIIC [Enterobacter sp. ENT03]MBV7405813.1 PTS transporter subunit EIIC [Enterobacter sp. ENT03]